MILKPEQYFNLPAGMYPAIQVRAVYPRPNAMYVRVEGALLKKDGTPSKKVTARTKHPVEGVPAAVRSVMLKNHLAVLEGYQRYTMEQIEKAESEIE